MARRYGRDDDATPAPRNDAYTGLLAISFFAMLGGCILLFLDYYSYDEAKPQPITIPEMSKAKVNAPPPRVEKKVEPKKEEPKKEEKKKEEMKKKEKMKKKE